MIRQEGLPELVTAWQATARACAVEGIQLGIADDGGFRTEADTTRDLGYRDQEWAIYAAKERKAGRTPQPMKVWRPINPYGTSYHNFGAARDGKIVSRPAGMSYDAAVKRVRALAVQNGLQGISSVNDQLHFQLPISLTTAQQWWREYTSKTGRYAVAGQTAVTPTTDDDAGNGVAGDGGTTPTPAGRAVMGAVLGIVVFGGLFFLVRRLTT